MLRKIIQTGCSVLALSTLSLALQNVPTGQAQSAHVIVVSKNSSISATKAELKEIYLGRKKEVGGVTVKPLDLPVADEARQTFASEVLGLSVSKQKSTYLKMALSGEATPPREVSREEMIKQIESDPSAVGYIPKDAVTSGLKVLLTL